MATRRPGHYHAVKFYETDEVWARIGAEFLGEGLAAQQPALVIATPEHRRRLTTELRARHFDVEAMEAAGDLVLFDAETMLGTFRMGNILLMLLNLLRFAAWQHLLLLALVCCAWPAIKRAQGITRP